MPRSTSRLDYGERAARWDARCTVRACERLRCWAGTPVYRRRERERVAHECGEAERYRLTVERWIDRIRRLQCQYWAGGREVADADSVSTGDHDLYVERVIVGVG